MLCCGACLQPSLENGKVLKNMGISYTKYKKQHADELKNSQALGVFLSSYEIEIY